MANDAVTMLTGNLGAVAIAVIPGGGYFVRHSSTPAQVGRIRDRRTTNRGNPLFEEVGLLCHDS